MLTFTTDAKAFFDKVSLINDIFYLYGAGMIGETCGRLLIKAGIDAFTYIDRNYAGRQLLGHEIIYPSELPENEHLIFVTMNDPLGAFYVLEQYKINGNMLVCNDNNDFNRVLSVCRNKLLHTKNFTIITNNCAGGVIYSALGCEFNSPFINMLIEPNDFVRLCNNIYEYLNAPLLFQ